jgi:hypothetical protein
MRHFCWVACSLRPCFCPRLQQADSLFLCCVFARRQGAALSRDHGWHAGGRRASRSLGADHRLMAALHGPGPDWVLRCHAMDNIRPVRNWTDLPSQTEFGVLPEPRDHWGTVVLFRQWAGRMEPDQPSMRMNEGQHFRNLPHGPCTLKGAEDGCWIKPV